MSPVRGRPPVKRARVLTALRRQIVAGRLPPGARLPGTRQLMKRFRANTSSVEAAIRHLRADGFVESRHRRGTFVTAHPPHVAHYALTFPFAAELMASQFYRALRAEATQRQLPELYFSLFYDILTRHDLPDYRRLADLMQRHALAGVIFAARPWGLWNDPVLTEPGVPRVAIAAGPHEADTLTVAPDHAAFLPRACEWLAGRNHRRVAFLGLASQGASPTQSERDVRAAAERCGLETQSRWIQALPAVCAPWATNLVASMVHGPAHDRPDALVITDDNLVPAATAGVLAAKQRVPDDLEVVAHANFPHVTPSAVPAQRLGFDVRRVLEVCVERLAQLRRGETPPTQSTVPVVFAEELAARPVRGRPAVANGARA